MMRFVGMEQHLSIVCDNCKTIACGKYWIHQRDQTHIKRYGPSLFGTRHRDFNLIAPGVSGDHRIKRKLMFVQVVESFLSNVVEISSTCNVDVLGVVKQNTPQHPKQPTHVNPG